MNTEDYTERVGRESRLLRIIAQVAPDIPPLTLLKELALHVLVFRGRTVEELKKANRVKDG
jgi:hypothetical protein